MWTIWEYIDHRGSGVLSEWAMDAAQRARLDEKIELLRNNGDGLSPRVLLPLKKQLLKLKIHGNVQFRALLCKGPLGDNEFTFLASATERDYKLPKGIEETARSRREEIIRNPARRRPYEG